MKTVKRPEEHEIIRALDTLANARAIIAAELKAVGLDVGQFGVHIYHRGIDRGRAEVTVRTKGERVFFNLKRTRRDNTTACCLYSRLDEVILEAAEGVKAKAEGK